MSLIVALGTNIGDKKKNLAKALEMLNTKFQLVAMSKVYTSKAIEYTEQADFLNQVLEFKIPKEAPDEIMQILLKIEQEMGRSRQRPKGPRIIDLDILFWGTESYQNSIVTIPHPRWNERSFVVYPLSELPFFETLEKCFTIPKEFKNTATVLEE